MAAVSNNNKVIIQNSTTDAQQQHHQQQQQQQQQLKKPKCRGNRKKQRYRRQLYAQGLNSEVVEKLVEEKISILQQREQHQQQQGYQQETSNEDDTDNIEVYIPLDRITLSQVNKLNIDNWTDIGAKRKRDILTPTTPTTPTLDQSLSQLSVSQARPQERLSKKTKTIASTERTNNPILRNQNTEASNNLVEKFKPHYLNVSDRILKQMLSNAAGIGNNDQIFRCLNTTEKLRLVRELTEATNDYYFKDLQRQLWQEYYEVGLKEGTWGSIVSKNFAHKHNTCRIYGRSKSSIERHQATITRELEGIRTKLDQYKQQLETSIKEWQPSIDLYTLSYAINECVKRGQQRLKEEFDFKKEILFFDSRDHQCLRRFYNLQPNNELIQLAVEIWQATANELKTKQLIENLRQRIHLKRLPMKIDKTIDQLLDDNAKVLLDPFCDQNQQASLVSRCSKAIIQCKMNLMLIQLDEYEIIMRRHCSVLSSLQEKLLNFHKENPNLCPYFFMNAIEERRQTMIERFNRIHQHNLKTFFDEAPMVVDNIDN